MYILLKYTRTEEGITTWEYVGKSAEVPMIEMWHDDEYSGIHVVSLYEDENLKKMDIAFIEESFNIKITDDMLRAIFEKQGKNTVIEMDYGTRLSKTDYKKLLDKVFDELPKGEFPKTLTLILD